MNEYNLCPKCGGVKPDRYEVVRDPVTQKPILKPMTGSFPACKCEPVQKPGVVVTEVKDEQ